ncbi:MAG: hypothetical protein LBI05_01440 [Planctomycetaceae bacterium]|jgi:hypothetical protein|nr:hypothetical protein [Planctomycetaceae bacterium]
MASMDAHFSRVLLLRKFGLLLTLLLCAMGANYETENFSVNASTAESARQYAETAEQYRKDMAMLWLGQTLPNWSAKCPIKVHVGNDLGAGGATSFVCENGEVFDWEMEIQGSHERILDSVLPHEITHMILASHFQTNCRKQIPRWLDEGMATSVEHKSEKANYRRMLRHFLQSDVHRCFPLNQIVDMKEYPSDPIPFYAQGFSLVEYLLEIGRQFDGDAHHRLVRFAQSAIQNDDWKSALQEHYGVQNLGTLQLSWIEWVGSGTQELPMVAAAARVYPPQETAMANVTVASVSARPPSGKSVYDRRVEKIPTQWNGENVQPIPTAFGQNVVVR